MAGGVGLLTVRLSVAAPVPPALVAPRVTLNVPPAAGVPEIIPVMESSDNPEGKPDALKLVGLLVAVMVYEKATDMVAVSVVELVMTGGGGLLTVSVNVAEPVPPALVALMLTLAAPADVGAPEITPVVALMDNPAGNPLAL